MMGFIIRLAIRNIGRNRRRSVLAAISVTLAMLMIVLAQSWIGGLMSSLVKNYTKNETGHVRIATKKFEERYRFMPVTEYIQNPSSLIAKISSDREIMKYVHLITERITFGVLLSNENGNKTALAMAGDPAKEKELLLLQQSILPGGRYLERSRDLLIGKGLADKLGFRQGDTVKLMTSGSDYALHLKKFVITGIIATGVHSFDNTVMQMSLTDARELLAMNGGTQQIIIMLKNYKNSDKVAALIRARVPDREIAVTSWTKIGDYYQFVQMAESMYNFIFVIVLLLGAFIISNIMMMVVMERRKEIGIMKSMGVTRKEMLALFLIEGTTLGFIGSIAGIIMSILIIIPVHLHGINIGAMVKTINFPIDNIVRPTLTYAGVLKVFITGTLLSGLVSLFPSRQAASMNAVDAIKSV